MHFYSADPNPHYRSLRLISTEGLWDLGFSPYHHGIRLRMGPYGRPPSVMDFCLGRDPELWGRVLAYTLDRLAPLPESADPKTIDAVFPWANARPDLRIHLPGLFTKDEHSCGNQKNLESPKRYSPSQRSYDGLLFPPEQSFNE